MLYTQVMHRTVNTLLDKTFKDKKKEIEKKEAQHQIEIKALTGNATLARSFEWLKIGTRT